LLRSEMANKNSSLEIDLPGRCECGFSNLNVWGTRINGSLEIEVQCMRCGKPLSKVEKDGV
jgi:hypothetical protein